MQSFQQTNTPIFEIQQGMNPQWGLPAHLNNLGMLPVMRTPALNVGAFACPPMSSPQLMSTRSPENVYQSNLKAQARIQAQQIDSAIQLLKMQYDAIMSSVQQSQSHNQPAEQLPPVPSTSAISTQVVDQTSFSAQFELPGPESNEQVATARVMDTATTCKRKTDSDDGISITSLVDSESSPPSKTSESDMRSNKRLRRQ